MSQMFNAASSVDDIYTELYEIFDALNALDDIIECEGYQPAGSYDSSKARCFIERLPLYQSTLRIILRDFSRVIAELKTTSDSLCDAAKNMVELEVSPEDAEKILAAVGEARSRFPDRFIGMNDSDVLAELIRIATAEH